MKVLVYHPTGNQNVRALLRGLERHDLLHSFHTTVAVYEHSWYYRLLTGKLSRFKRRTYDDSLKSLTHIHPLQELLMFAHVRKMFRHRLTPDYIDLLINKKVSKYIKKHHSEIDAVYCYPGHSSIAMRTARQYGIKCIYELTTAYYKHILHINGIEDLRNPSWARTITIGRAGKAWGKERDEELSMADMVVCASTYIKSTLIEFNCIAAQKTVIVPYGFPNVQSKTYQTGHTINLLYVGNLSQLKGLSYLFDAVDKLKGKVNLTIIGNGPLASGNLKNVLKKYNYIGTLPHDEVLAEMRKADVFVFPTLSDGFGMVITEAMAMGTPVITTNNSCGKDIITYGENGWIIPIQDSKALLSVIDNIIEQPQLVQRMGEGSIKTAIKRPWKDYEDDIAKLLMDSFSLKP